jgi:hypothetical protein
VAEQQVACHVEDPAGSLGSVPGIAESFGGGAHTWIYDRSTIVVNRVLRLTKSENQSYLLGTMNRTPRSEA